MVGAVEAVGAVSAVGRADKTNRANTANAAKVDGVTGVTGVWLRQPCIPSVRTTPFSLRRQLEVSTQHAHPNLHGAPL